MARYTLMGEEEEEDGEEGAIVDGERETELVATSVQDPL